MRAVVLLFIGAAIAQVAWYPGVAATTTSIHTALLSSGASSLGRSKIGFDQDGARNSLSPSSFPKESLSTTAPGSELVSRARSPNSHRRGSFFHLGPSPTRGRGHFSTPGASSSRSTPQASRATWDSSSGSDSDTPRRLLRNHGHIRRPAGVSLRSPSPTHFHIDSLMQTLQSPSPGLSSPVSWGSLHSQTSSGSGGSGFQYMSQASPPGSRSRSPSPSPLTTHAPSRALSTSSVSSLSGPPHSSAQTSVHAPDSTHSSPGGTSQVDQKKEQPEKLKKASSW